MIKLIPPCFHLFVRVRFFVFTLLKPSPQEPIPNLPKLQERVVPNAREKAMKPPSVAQHRSKRTAKILLYIVRLNTERFW